MSYLDLLPNDLTFYALAKINLTDFQLQSQEAIVINLKYPSFRQRYFLRYGTDYPKVNHKFASDIDQYLFCAGHFHLETGFRSHLFVPMQICVRGAIKQYQPKLVEYFLDRGGTVDTAAINFMIALDAVNCVHLIPQFSKEHPKMIHHYSIYRETKIRSFEMAKKLAKKATAIEEIYRDRPRSEYPTFDKILESLPTGTSDPIDDHRLIGKISAAASCDQTSGSKKLLKSVKQYCLWAEIKQVYQFTSVVALLDDVRLLEKRLPTIFENLKNGDVHRVNYVFGKLGSHCAVNCFRWFASRYKFDARKPADELMNWFMMSTDEIRSVSSTRQLEMIKILDEYLEISFFCRLQNFLCAVTGNAKLLFAKFENVIEIEEVAGHLLENGHLELLKQFQKEKSLTSNVMAGGLSSIHLDRIDRLNLCENIISCFEMGITEFTWDNEDSLDFVPVYPDYLALSAVRITDESDIPISWVLARHVPTPEIASIFKFSTDEIPLFLTFPPTRKPSQIVEIFSKGNTEYAEYFASQYPDTYKGDKKYLYRRFSDLKISTAKMSTKMKEIFLRLFPDYVRREKSQQINYL